MAPISGVAIHPLVRIEDAQGPVLRMLRSDEPHFEQFGEIYFSTVFPGAIKAWRRHRNTTSNLAVPIGLVQLVLFDDRPDSPTSGVVADLVLGGASYNLVTVPPGIWSGFRGLGESAALVANCANRPHDPDEAERRDAFDSSIPFQWPR